MSCSTLRSKKNESGFFALFDGYIDGALCTFQYMCWTYDSFGNRTLEAAAASPFGIACSVANPTSSYQLSYKCQQSDHRRLGPALGPELRRRW